MDLQKMYGLLYQAFGPQHWWPGDSPFEVMVGAILTQNTAWSNVELAISNLKNQDKMGPEAMGRMEPDDLALLIRPAGYFNIKARRLLNMVRLVLSEGGGDPPVLLKTKPQTLRQKLLAVSGIGPETADSILLYAADQPFFVIDAYTRRVLSRHGPATGKENYDQLQQMFMKRLPKEVRLYNEYHALLVKLGKDFCRPTPVCTGCPLEDYLAEDLC